MTHLEFYDVMIKYIADINPDIDVDIAVYDMIMQV
jgi:hypothetical protein